MSLIRFDFSLKTQSNQLRESLEMLYEQETQEYFESHFISSRASITCWNYEYNVEQECSGTINDIEYFDSIETTVYDSSEYFLDIITIGTLSDNEINSLNDSDDRRVDEWENELEKVPQSIPVLANGEAHPSVIIHIDLGKELDPWEGTEVDHDAIYDYVNENDEILNQFNFNLMGYISLIRSIESEQIIVPKFPRHIWGPLLAVQLSPSQWETGPMSLPGWAKYSRGFLPFFRSHHWLRHRVDHIQSIDSETYEFGNFIRPSESSLESSKSFLDFQKELTEIRQQWISIFSQTIDESNEITDILERWRSELSSPEFPISSHVHFHETQIPKPSRSGIQIGNESLLEMYQDYISSQLDYLDQTLDRVGRKLNSISDFTHDATNIELQEEVADATEASLKFQRRVYIFTIILVILTVIIVAPTIFEIFQTLGNRSNSFVPFKNRNFTYFIIQKIGF